MQFKKFKTLLAIAVLLSAPITGWCMDIVASDSNYYYQMGGGSDLSMPPVTKTRNVTISGDIDADLGYSCDGFNPSVSIANTFNNIKQSVQGIKRDVINSATAAVGSMPMYILNKTNKDLYNMLENTMSSAQDTFHMSMKSCQEAMDDIKDGKSPYQDWFSMSDSQGWMKYIKQSKQGQKVDINHARKQLSKNPHKYGVQWVHNQQSSGGSVGNQVPIRVMYDVVVAGFNAMVDPKADLDQKNTTPDGSTGLGQYFDNADDAGHWAQLVLGEIKISSKQGHNDTKRGKDLMTIAQSCPKQSDHDQTCVKTIKKQMADIVSSGETPTPKQLKQISSDEMVATPKIIESIRNQTKQNKAVTINKWAEDVALQNIIDKAFMLRRLLIAGSQTQPVHNSQPALDAVHRSLKQLNKQIHNVLFQFKARQQMMGNTAASILQNQSQSEIKALNSNTQTQEPPMKHGAVYQDQNH